MAETPVIVDVVRTASGRGKPGGALSGIHPVDLSATVLSALLERNGLDSKQVDDVIWGTVSQVGEQSMNIARRAVLAAGFDESVPGVSIDRQCGSSQQAVHFAAQGIIAGAYDIVIVGGAESMSRVPLGSSAVGGDTQPALLEERYPEGLVHQGISAELIASKWGFTRENLDTFAAESHRRAGAALSEGRFDGSILPVSVIDAEGIERVHNRDETVREGTTAEKLAGLSPAFYRESLSARFPEIQWSITPGNSSPLTDGASAALIMSERKALELGLTPRARVFGFGLAGADPLMMLTAPIPATQKILARTGMAVKDIDVYEVNEAFASVPLAWLEDMHADPSKLNPWGGAIALGHALGSSGTRLLGTMLEYLEHTGGRYGLQTMCEGGGMANATLIERL